MKNILTWFIAAFSILFGLVTFPKSAMSGGLTLLAGIFISPPFQNVLINKFNLVILNKNLVRFAIFFFVAGIGITSSFSGYQKELAEEFSKNKEQILAEIKDKLAKGDLTAADDQLRKYSSAEAENKELSDLKSEYKDLKKKQDELAAKEEQKKKEAEAAKAEAAKKEAEVAAKAEAAKKEEASSNGSSSADLSKVPSGKFRQVGECIGYAEALQKAGKPDTTLSAIRSKYIGSWESGGLKIKACLQSGNNLEKCVKSLPVNDFELQDGYLDAMNQASNAGNDPMKISVFSMGSDCNSLK